MVNRTNPSPEEQTNPYSPPGPRPLVFEQFEGMDQSGNRASVEDRQMWWCDGWIPLDHRHLRTLPGVGDSIYPGIGGNDAYTKIMLHFDGPDSSTVITDVNAGGSSHAWTAAGNAQLDTANYKFGTAALLCDGTGDYLSTPDSPDFSLGTNAFTIDCWFNCTAPGGDIRTIAGQADDGFTSGSSWLLQRSSGNVIRFLEAAAGNQLLGTTQFTSSINTGWHHVAVVRSGSTLTLYVDGISESTTSISTAFTNSAEILKVGAWGPSSFDPWMGWIDEFRLSVGIARWTANFTPPTQAYVTVGQIVFFDFGNIEATPSAIVFLANGSVQEVVTTTGVVTEILPPGTISDPNRYNCDMSQWGNQYIIIVANQTNGYWLWDGSLKYGSGSLAPGVVMTFNGSGYTGAPTVTAYGGSGSGASLTAIYSGGIITGVSIVAPGSGWLATDVAGIAFTGGGITAKTAIITTGITNGTISSTTITNAGSGYTSAAAASVYGGGGSGASLTLGITSTTISAVTIANAGKGFVTAPTVIVTDVNNPVARASVSVMPLGVGGNAVETYQGHVWVADGPTVYFSSPGNPGDFSTNLGGGNFTSSSSNLRIGFTKLRASNGFLYLVADSSIQYISGVNTSGNPATTTFSIQDADPESGSSWPGTVITFGRSIFYANSFGVHSLAGANTEKFSIDIDNLFDSVPDFAGLSAGLSSAKATIFNRKCYMVLCPIVNPYTGDTENKLLLFNNKKWFASGQDVDLLYIATQEINSELTAWGTDGTSLYPLFQQPSDQFTKVVQSRFWDVPGYEFQKYITRFWAIFDNYMLDQTLTATVTIDSERSSQAYSFTSPTDVINVINASSVTIPTINASSTTISVVSIREGYYMTEPTAIGQNGIVTGMTLYTNEEDVVLISAKMQPEIVQYRG